MQIVSLKEGCVNTVVCGAGVAREAAQMSRVSCIHVFGDPLRYRDLELKLEVQRFNSAIVLCDAAWVTIPSLSFTCKKSLQHYLVAWPRRNLPRLICPPLPQRKATLVVVVVD